MGCALLIYSFLSRHRGQINDFVIINSRAYLANGSEGLSILNVEDPENIYESASLRCTGPFPIADRYRQNFLQCINNAENIFNQSDSILVADDRNGVWMFEFTEDPDILSPVAYQRLSGQVLDIVASENYAYVASGRQGIRILQILTPADVKNNPANQKNRLQLINNQPLSEAGNARQLFLNGKIIYWSDNRNTIHVLNINKKNDPVENSTYETDFEIHDMAFLGQYGLLAADSTGIVILDISDPKNLVEISRLSLNGPARGIAINGNHAYLTVQGRGIVAVDLTYLTQPRILISSPSEVISGEPSKILISGEYSYIVNSGYQFIAQKTFVEIRTKLVGSSGTPLYVRGTAKSGNFAYLAASERGLRVIDVSNPSVLNEVAFLDTAGRADAVAVAGAIAYIADRHNGLVMADLTNQTGSLGQIAHFPGKDTRDVAVSDNFAYVADFEEGLKIIDVTRPVSATLVTTMAPVDGQIIKPNGLAVLGDFTYLASLDQGLRIVNILDKNLPTQVLPIQVPNQADARNVAVVVFNPQSLTTAGVDPFPIDPRTPGARIYAYVANGTFGLQLFDVTQPNSGDYSQIPLDSNIATLPGVAMDVAINRDRAYLAYDGGAVYILDTSNPAAPKYVGVVNLSQSENRALGLSVDGSMLYLAAANHGLQVIDTSNTVSPAVIGQYAAPAVVTSLAEQDGYLYTVDGSRGLWLFDVSDPDSPQEVQFLGLPEASGVAVTGNYAFVASGTTGIKIVNISDKNKFVLEGSLDTPGAARSILVSSRTGSDQVSLIAYVADYGNGLLAVDVTNPGAPATIGSLGGINQATRLTYNDTDYIYVSADGDGLVAVNVVEPQSPTRMDNTEPENVPVSRGAALVGDKYAYVAAGAGGLAILDVSYPLAMKYEGAATIDASWVENVSVPQLAQPPGVITDTISIPPYYAFMVDRDNGVGVLETVSPTAPLLRGTWKAPGDPETGQPAEVVQVLANWIPPKKDGKEPGFFRMYVADAHLGFKVVDGTKVAHAVTHGIYETGGIPPIQAMVPYLRAKIRLGQTNLPESEGGQNLEEKDQGVGLIPIDNMGRTIHQFLMDVLLFGAVAFFLWLGLMAFFVLPLDNFSDWDNLYSRLIYYLFNRHGPVIHVKEGKVIGEHGESKRAGPGLVLVDANSAAVLDKRNFVAGRQPDGASSGLGSLPLARVAGAGVVYTGNRNFLSRPRYDEILRGTADLRRQIRFATQVSGYTRDGIEVETLVFTLFTLGERPEVVGVTYVQPTPSEDEQNQPPNQQPDWKDLRVVSFKQSAGRVRVVKDFTDELDEADKKEIHQALQANPQLLPLQNIEDFQRRVNQSNQPDWESAAPDGGGWTPGNSHGAAYILDPVRIFQAIFARAENMAQGKDLDWSELPTYVTIGIFRDLLAAEIYDQLYLPMRPNEYPVRILKTQLRWLMRSQGVLAYHYVRTVNGEPLLKWREYTLDELLSSQIHNLRGPKILRSRGIKVYFAGFSELLPVSDNVRQQFFDYWRAQRDQETDIVSSDFDVRVLRLRNRWRNDAQREIINELVNILDVNPQADEALAMHVMQALEAAAADPETRQLMPEDTIEMLRSLRNWLLRI